MLSVITLILQFLFLAELQLMGIEGRPAILSFVLIILFTVAFLADLALSPTLKKYSVPLLLGYLLRIFFLFFDCYASDIYTLPNSGADSELFYNNAVQFVTGNNARSGAFITLMGTVMKWIGVSRVYSQFLIVLFSIVALVFAARAMEYIDATWNTKRRCMFILCLLPNFAILSSIFLRESVVAMFLSISFYNFVKWIKGDKNFTFWLAVIFAFCASAFHSGCVGVAVGYVVVLLMFDKSNQRFRFTLKSCIPTIFFVLVFAFLYLNYSDVLFAKMGNINSIEDIASGVSRGNSSYAQYVGNSSTPLNMLIYTIPRMFYFLFSPFPWQWRGLSDIIAFCFSAMFYIVSIVSAFKYLKTKEPENRALVIALLLVAVCTLFIFGWGTSNVGTAVRHRDKVIILYGILWCCTAKIGKAKR